MSNESKLDGLSFRLPNAEEIEVVLVRLDDGRIVARTKDELELLARTEPAAEGAAEEL